MPAELPYLASYKNVDKLFEKIASAKQPEVFTHRYLSDTLLLKSTGDRALIPLLRTLGFIDAAGRPTAEYGALKNADRAPYAIGEAVKRAYKPLFDANESANALAPDQLKGLIAQVTGSDDGMTKRVSGTFNSLLKVAKFGAAPSGSPRGAELDERVDGEEDEDDTPTKKRRAQGLKPEFHYNFQVHLPANGTEETYLNIFNALRKVFL